MGWNKMGRSQGWKGVKRMVDRPPDNTLVRAFDKGVNAVLDPRSVAVIGASSTFGKWGQLIMSNIVAGRFQGKVFPVNPGKETVYGLPAYEDIRNIPDDVDLAFITIPSETVPAILEACGEKGVKAVVLITSGYREIGEEGRRLERDMVDICRKLGLLLVGPNTMGIIRPYVSLFATGSHTRPREGNVAFVAQSGNLGVQLIRWAEQQGIGISLFVGSGNEAMANSTDYLEALENDPHTGIITLYVESVGDGRRFMEVAGRIARKKPIILLKGGRTEPGRMAAVSHTGSMSGEDSFFRAACSQTGVLNVRMPSELLDLSAGFSSLPLPRGNRVGIVTNGGGWGVVTADECSEKGLEVPDIPEHIIEIMDEYLPPFWSRGNPLDLVGTRDRTVPLVAVEELLKWDGIDAVISLAFIGRHGLTRSLIRSIGDIDSSASPEFLGQLDKSGLEFEKEYIARIAELMELYEKPVIGVSLTKTDEGTVRPVAGRRYNGVFYETPEDAVNVLARMAAYRQFLDRG